MKILLVVDVQKDFIDGALGSEAAQKVLPAIKDYVEKIRKGNNNRIIFTQDNHSHCYDYENTIETLRIPPHCIASEIGSAIMVPIAAQESVVQKDSFMMDLVDAKDISTIIDCNYGIDTEIEIIGYCTDICVISNALLLRKVCPCNKITIIENLCAGTSEEAHKAALTIAKSCLIDVRTEE